MQANWSGTSCNQIRVLQKYLYTYKQWFKKEEGETKCNSVDRTIERSIYRKPSLFFFLRSLLLDFFFYKTAKKVVQERKKERLEGCIMGELSRSTLYLNELKREDANKIGLIYLLFTVFPAI